MVRAAASIILTGLALLQAAPALAVDDERAAFIDVAGAPGDGEQALERALSNRFLDLGFRVTGTPEVNAYEIQGTVKLTPTTGGKVSVRIDWTVFGPEATRLGVVTQTKVIRRGSLDKTWGPAANAAADAAAQDILELLAKQSDGPHKAQARGVQNP
jgi:hypothetical protein